jgi:hypothetical protein
MSDDLVKRLRDMSNYYNSGGRFVAADRIEELEAKLEKAAAALQWCATVHDSSRARTTLAELKGQE